MTHEETTYHLRMTDERDLRARPPVAGFTVARQSPPDPQINHAFFMEVGTPYRWYSRLDWTFDRWETYVNDPLVGTWLGYMEGRPFGYFELQQRHHSESSDPLHPAGTQTEIMFFGVLPSFHGRGLGAALLGAAVQEAWSLPGTQSVYVHTCSADHPAALGNYVSRGFTLFFEQTEIETIPDDDDPVWASPEYYRTLRARYP